MDIWKYVDTREDKLLYETIVARGIDISELRSMYLMCAKNKMTITTKHLLKSKDIKKIATWSNF